MAFLGPITLVRRVIARLNRIGWTRAAGSLAYTTLLGLVPLATVAFAVVAQFPVFQDFVHILESYLLRYMLPNDARDIVQEYVVGLATVAAEYKGFWIVFVTITAVLVANEIESEINAIWGIRRKRPLLRRVLIYTIGVTAGPVLVGAAIMLISWLLSTSITAVAFEKGAVEAISTAIPFLITVAGFTLLYAFAPARKVAWRHAVIGGALAAVASEAVRYGFASYVVHSPSYEILYGALAAFPLFLAWVFAFWMIVLAGAAITASLADPDHGD
ncbi:MAG: YihY family inner membrane protein [Burkholderiales bacterium]|nr:YihY family inner membrane protein [Burkholderiales bacterium]